MDVPTFDIRGNLLPYAVNEITLETFEKWYRIPFGEASRRHALIEEYKRYTADLLAVLGKPFYQWINGSFIRNVENPHDIDLVTFIDHEAYSLTEETTNAYFSKWTVANSYPNLDAYLVRTYPTNHQNFLTFQADRAYWYDWFSKTRRDKNRRRYDKGFIQITVK